MKTRGEIVRTWREERKLSPAKLGAMVGTSRQNIENLEAGTVGEPRYLRELARVMGYRTVEELLDLQDPPTVIDVTETAPATSGAVQVARPLSEAGFRIPQKPMSWGDLKMKKLRETFEVTLEDDAMAPDFPAGYVIRFNLVGPTVRPAFGNRVLVRDAKRDFHFRVYAQSDDDDWEAKASNPAFRRLLPSKDGATVVAVKAGHYVPGA